jgi:hypothetical protein
MKTALRFVVGGLIRLTVLGLSTGPPLSRYAMYRRVEQFRVDARPNQRALSISGSVELWQLLGFDTDQITEADHPEFDATDSKWLISTWIVLLSPLPNGTRT